MLRVIPDRELAKEAARANVSALLLGQPRIVSPEVSLSVERLRGVLTHGGEDLDTIRHVFSSLLERLTPAIERPRGPRTRDLGPER
jgi:hypothetical protein